MAQAEFLGPALPQSVESPHPTLRQLFLAFSGIAVIGFGGVMPWARRMLVERKRWLTPDEFNEAFALAQFLPGGNVLNLSVVVGRRFRGGTGSLAAVVGLLAGPFLIVSLAALAYFRYGEVAAVHDALAGLAAAAAGLVVAMACSMAKPLIRRREALPAVIALAAFAAITAGAPLLPVVGILAPLSIALAWRTRQ